MFDDYEMASPRDRYEMLKDRDFAVLRFRWILQNLNGVRADSIRALADHLCNVGSFLTAPASSKKRYHLSEPGGLLRHSLWVSDNYWDLLSLYEIPMDPTSARLVSLFHDASKAGIGGLTDDDLYQPRYLELTEEEKRRTREDYRYNPELQHLVLATGSLWMVSSFVKLSASEAACIAAHDGQYCLENRSYAHRLPPEGVILCQADEASLIFEKESA